MGSPFHPTQLPSYNYPAVFDGPEARKYSGIFQADDDSEPKFALIVRMNVDHSKAHSTEVTYLATHDYRCCLSGLDEFFSDATAALGHGPG